MPLTEFKAKYLGYKAAEKKTVKVTEEPITDSAVPASVDWTTSGAVNAVKN
jgi:hypothetical protein